MRDKHNYVILHDGEFYRVFERLGNVPFEAYNPHHHLGIGVTCEEAIRKSVIPTHQIEHDAYEVIFNE